MKTEDSDYQYEFTKRELRQNLEGIEKLEQEIVSLKASLKLRRQVTPILREKVEQWKHIQAVHELTTK